MRCPQCQAENEATAKFCAECGVSLAARDVRPPPRVYIFCPKCGSDSLDGGAFCRACGSRFDGAPVATAQTQRGTTIRPEKSKTSWAWWLLPLVFTWLGGLIAFVVLRNRNFGKAKWILILGLVLTVIETAGVVLLNLAAWSGSWSPSDWN
ncbi:MAG: zinc-ribbon domain-containing protein [Chloroflexi bacterium]|nr:zinc-ribbon domain-containing protein [Chloroflexota bacterium]